MPELPEVQTIVNDLKASAILGASVFGARVSWPASIAQPGAAEFCRRIRDRTLGSVRRRGKYIVFDFAGGGHLLIHLRMSGRLHLVPARQPVSKHEHVILRLDDGRELRLHDTRKFGRVHLVEGTQEIFNGLGFEPLEAHFTARALGRMVGRRRRSIKPLLLDQGMIAGLGNIYADEALWRARVHPLRSADSLNQDEIRRLHRAIRSVLRQGLANAGTSLGAGKNNFHSIGDNRGRNQEQLRVYGRRDQPCSRCRTAIERIVVSQRSSHLCPICQRL